MKIIIYSLFISVKFLLENTNKIKEKLLIHEKWLTYELYTYRIFKKCFWHK